MINENQVIRTIPFWGRVLEALKTLFTGSIPQITIIENIVPPVEIKSYGRFVDSRHFDNFEPSITVMEEQILYPERIAARNDAARLLEEQKRAVLLAMDTREEEIKAAKRKSSNEDVPSKKKSKMNPKKSSPSKKSSLALRTSDKETARDRLISLMGENLDPEDTEEDALNELAADLETLWDEDEDEYYDS